MKCVRREYFPEGAENAEIVEHPEDAEIAEHPEDAEIAEHRRGRNCGASQ